MIYLVNDMDNEKVIRKSIEFDDTDSENIGIGTIIGYFGILAIICISSFLLAKYILRSNIGWEKTPVDTSERLG